MLGESTSLCEGTVYLEIRPDPRGLFVSPQFVGAQFGEADRDTVQRHLRRPKATGKGRRLE